LLCGGAACWSSGHVRKQRSLVTGQARRERCRPQAVRCGGRVAGGG